MMQDKLDTVWALSDGAKSVNDVNTRIDKVFAEDTPGVAFSTVHKAKGLEAEKVWILEPHLMPLSMAKKPWEQVQEHNIQYVAYTRSLHTLNFVRG